MTPPRHCADCGAPLAAEETQPVCAACIFQRLLSTGSTIMPAETGGEMPASAAAGTDFYTDYELLEEIGRGGMGVIYRAHQVSLNRVVALKVIHHASHAGSAARQRFQAEVAMAAGLSHPHIVPVFETGELDGAPCFSMEYFPRGTLAERMPEFAAAPASGVRLLVKVARAVGFAHQRGVLHRDVKPANILLDEDGEPHVADFGLAKLLDSDSDLTRSGAVLGSPNYMSPEQASGKAGALTVATDIYSLGVILYQMLTGRTPFIGETALETMRMVVEKEPQRPSTITARVDRDLETICLKCLEKEPARRYRTAEELADDLERWERHEPVLARPTGAGERLWKWMRRRPALAAMLALLITALTAGVAGVTWQWRHAEQARQGEKNERRRAEEALAASAFALAEVALREGDSRAVRAALDNVPPAFREATWHYFQQESDTSEPVPVLAGRALQDLVASPAQASVFAAAQKDGKVVVFHALSGERLVEFVPGFDGPEPRAPLRLAISPDSRRIAVARRGAGGGVVVHQLADGQKLAAWPAPSCHSLEYSPDGQRLLLVTGGREKTLLFEESGGKPLWEYADGYCVSHFAADRRRLLDYSWAAGLRVLHAADRSELAVLPGQYFEAFAAQPGGNLAVASNVHGFVRGYDMDSGLVRFEFQPSQTPPDLLTFLPGGEQFLTATALPDGRQWLQCRDSRSGHALHSLHGGGGTIQMAAVHPLSGELLIIGNEARLWRTMSVPPLRLLRGANTHPSAVFWSGDDVLFAPDGQYGSAALQQWSGDAMQLLWQPADGEVGQPHVSADGRRVALGRYHSASPPVAVLERDASGVRQVAEIGLPFPLGYARLSPSGDRLALVDMAFSRAVIHGVSPAARPVMLETKGLHRISDLAWIGGGGQIAGLITTGAPRGQAGSVEETAVWDAATGRLLRSVVSGSIGTVLAASPDGTLLAEAGGDRSVRLRDAATLALRRSFRAHNAPITALAWHPSRPVVATASEDLLIRLWNTGTGERLEELRGPLSPPTVLSFSPGGTRLATAARDGVARVWEPHCLTPEK